MRVARRLTIGGLTAAVCLAVAAPAAQAWVRAAEAAGDPQTTWVVTQTTITIRSTDPVLLQFVRGSQVRFGCDERGAKAAHHPLPLVYWGRDATSITAHVAGLVGSALTVCEAADWGGAPGFPLATGNFSRAPFDSAWRRRLAGTPAPGPLLAHYQLVGYWLTVGEVVGNRDANLYGQLVRLPPAPTLVKEFNRRFSGPKIKAGVLYAPILAGVIVPHVVYVVGQGTGAKRLEMAVIGFDGRRYVMYARLMHRPTYSEGPGTPRLGFG